jgi:hypothetical protein
MTTLLPEDGIMTGGRLVEADIYSGSSAKNRNTTNIGSSC